MARLLSRIDAIERRLSILEQRVGTRPDLRELDREIAQVRRDKEAAIEAQDFENSAALRDRENGCWTTRPLSSGNGPPSHR